MYETTIPRGRPLRFVSAFHPRRGFTIPEVMLAGALLAVILSSAIPLLYMAARHRILVTQRVVAAELVASRLSNVAAVPYGELTTERLTALLEADTSSHFFSDVKHNWSVSSTQVTLGCKELLVTLQWFPQPGQMQQVQLRQWRFPEPQPAHSTAEPPGTPGLEANQSSKPETSVES